ncbi:hypothetical protein ACIGFL_14345 [Pseudomonas sp. NPDC077649]|uniref:hypothetical protein n=1 Tax=Pseudomonas sp. NPDC077649 TaxID=3364423 RepID=UPI0037CB19E3
MTSMTKSAVQLTVERRLREALELLKRSAGYASSYPSIGGHKLNDEICQFRHDVLAELDHATHEAEKGQASAALAWPSSAEGVVQMLHEPHNRAMWHTNCAIGRFDSPMRPVGAEWECVCCGARAAYPKPKKEEPSHG